MSKTGRVTLHCGAPNPVLIKVLGKPGRFRGLGLAKSV